MKITDTYVVYQHNEHYTSPIEGDLIFETQEGAEVFSATLAKQDWKAPVKVAALSEFIGDYGEHMKDDGYDLAYKDCEYDVKE